MSDEAAGLVPGRATRRRHSSGRTAAAAGGIGIGGGTLDTLVAFVAMSKVGDVTSSTGGFGTASVGFGLVFLLLSSLAVIAFGILTIVLRRR